MEYGRVCLKSGIIASRGYLFCFHGTRLFIRKWRRRILRRRGRRRWRQRLVAAVNGVTGPVRGRKKDNL
jgi:hypothetical protein